MERLWQVLEESRLPSGAFTIQGVLLTLLLAFILGQALAWIYYLTHSGLSYSRSFVQSLIIVTIVVAMVMLVIGNNIITAVGLMGAFTIIRFRNMLKDTRDIAFMFTALAAGMATGCRLYATAVVGTAFVCLVMVYLFLTDFGSHQPHNGFLRFTLKGPIHPDHPVLAILGRFCSSYILLSRQDTGYGEAAEYAYQVMVRNARRSEQMLGELEEIEGLEGINLTMQEKLLEV
ncbi:MAG: DUF4956 domain-containing protein [Phycisphaerae bacterium]|mgnify:CR=1 FL=1|nr:DUF4956 domain-containing protein [Phycisphaerae bacterium]